MWRFEARPAPDPRMRVVTPILAAIATGLTGAVLFAALGHAPLGSLYNFFIGPITTTYGLAELAVKATPLILCALGLAFCFRANVWNIGAEGQLTLGAVFGGGLGAMVFYATDGLWVLPLMLVAGVAGGVLWAMIPAVLKTRLGVNEILSSLMLTYVALLLLSALVHGPWRDPDGFNFPESRIFGFSATLPVVVEGTRLHLGALLTLALAAVAWVVLSRTLFGFQLTVAGGAPRAARFAGFSSEKITLICFAVSGGLAGLAGVIEVTGPVGGQLVPEISPGYGFTAIIVAFLGRLHPVGIVLAGLLVALSYLGGEYAQIVDGLPDAVTGVFQGLLLFYLLAADVLVRYRLRYVPVKQPA